MNTQVAVLLMVVGCGGSQAPKPVEGKAETATTLAALDTQLAHLEGMRPYIVVKGEVADCAAYTPEASAALAKVGGQTSAADAARSSSPPDELTSWQAAHRDDLEKVLADIVLPTRMVTDCAAMAKDDTWPTLSAALVAVAQPPAPPPAIARRREAMQELSALAASLTAKEDCHKINDLLDGKYKDVDAQLKSMSNLERFIDDKVWEEEDEKRFEKDENITKVMSLCGAH